MTRLKPGILYSKSQRCFKWIAFRSKRSSFFFEKQHGLKHHLPLFLFLYFFFEYQTQNSTTLCPPPKKKEKRFFSKTAGVFSESHLFWLESTSEPRYRIRNEALSAGSHLPILDLLSQSLQGLGGGLLLFDS